MTDAKLQAMTKRFKQWKGKVPKWQSTGWKWKIGWKYQSGELGEESITQQWQSWKSGESIKVQNWKYLKSEKLGARENLLLRFIPQCADPSIAPANLKSSCSQYMSGPLHGVFFCAKFLFTIYVWTPPWRFFLCKVFAHNLCPDPSMAVFLQSFCSQYMSRPLHGALLLVCSQDASGFLHLGVASYPSPSSHILTQNLCPSETVSYLEKIFSELELVMRVGNRFWWQ